MAVNWKVVSDQQVTALRSALYHGENNLDVIPKLVRTLLKGDLWKCRFVEQIQEEVEFTRFPEFVTAPAPKGLGTSVEILKKFCQSAGDTEAVDLIRKAVRRKGGRPYKTVDNVNGLERPDGNSADRALQDLEAKRPDLHSRVLAKEISPHGAMVEAGLRVKTHTIPHDPVRAAGVIGRYFSREEVVSLLLQLKATFLITDEELR